MKVWRRGQEPVPAPGTAVVWGRDTTFVAFGINPVLIRTGELWDASDPVVQEYPELFEADPFAVPGRVRRSSEPVDEVEAWASAGAAEAAAELLAQAPPPASSTEVRVTPRDLVTRFRRPGGTTR